MLVFLPLAWNNQRASAQASRVLMVNQADDSGDGVCDATCTLRDAVIEANTTNPLNDEIIFAPHLSTIVLNAEIAIDQAGYLEINGPGADRLTINGGPGSNRIFYTFSSSQTNSSELRIRDLTLTGGNGGGNGINGWGGAIYADRVSLLLHRVHITGNTAATGGGIYCNFAELRIFESTLSNNTATIDCGGFSSAALLVVNSTISSNTAGGDGGGFCHWGSGFLDSVSITANTAHNGGGIVVNPGTLEAHNSIIAGNEVSVGVNSPEIYVTNFPNPANFISGGYNLVGDQAGDSTNTNVAIAYQSTDILDTSPQFLALGNYGGPTPTHALQFGSPARDAADPAGGTPEDFDQRGFPRPAGAWDIGSFEIQDSTAPIAAK